MGKAKERGWVDCAVVLPESVDLSLNVISQSMQLTEKQAVKPYELGISACFDHLFDCE